MERKKSFQGSNYGVNYIDFWYNREGEYFKDKVRTIYSLMV